MVGKRRGNLWSRALKLEGEIEVKGVDTNFERKGNFIFIFIFILILTNARERLGRKPQGVLGNRNLQQFKLPFKFGQKRRSVQ